MAFGMNDIRSGRLARVQIARSFVTSKQATITGMAIEVVIPVGVYEVHGKLSVVDKDVVVTPVNGSGKVGWRSNINNLVALEYLE